MQNVRNCHLFDFFASHLLKKLMLLTRFQNLPKLKVAQCRRVLPLLGSIRKNSTQLHRSSAIDLKFLHVRHGRVWWILNLRFWTFESKCKKYKPKPPLNKVHSGPEGQIKRKYHTGIVFCILTERLMPTYKKKTCYQLAFRYCSRSLKSRCS